MQRWIIHVDMDAFFASVEQRDNDQLRGKPVIVGGLGSRGVVSTASYEARRFGVHSAMPMAEARRLCPQGIYLPGDHKKYVQVSARIQDILADFSPVIEPLSLDEAFLDMTGMERLFPDIAAAARQIKKRIRGELELTASAGAAPNKFLAKLASDLEKPDGLVVIRPGEAAAVLEPLSVSHLWGVGKAATDVLHKLGIKTIGQLARTDAVFLAQYFGKAAYEMNRLSRGLDDRPVIPGREPKSVGKEVTFETDLLVPEDIRSQLLLLAEKVGWRLRRRGYFARTITVKIRFASFRTITRRRTLMEPTQFDEVLFATALDICRGLSLPEGIRLLGISAANLQSGGGQISLFDGQSKKRSALYRTLDQLKARFGEGIVTKGSSSK